MMLNNEKIVRELYAAAEGSGKDIAKLVSFFSDEGYMCDIPSGLKLHGQAIGDAIEAFARAFLMFTVSYSTSMSRRTW
jgi:hypothetical protein